MRIHLSDRDERGSQFTIEPDDTNPKLNAKTGRPQTHRNLKSAPESTRVSQVLKAVMVREKLLPHLCRCDQAHYYQDLTRLHKYRCDQTESHS